MDVPAGVFQGSIDRFNGVTVDSAIETNGNCSFEAKLAKSLTHWTEVERRGIWFKVHTVNADWVPVLAKNGFTFHHAKEGFVAMYKWLPTDESANIPHCAHTMLAVGALVLNEQNQILVVSDKYSMIKDSWKLPGGYVEPGENIADAAVREVFEETNVLGTFETMLAMRHAHEASFGFSDLYVVVALKPTTTEIVKCEREIAKCEWMNVDEYLSHPHVHKANRSFLKLYLSYKQRGLKIDCQHQIHEILKREYTMFVGKFDEDSDSDSCS